ncbi:hypothetical protein CVT26_013814 [Gymnopilus dilepis]|uniref:Zn(2)-C6 fungal-type domain-containing protein n=1 Tax=Gymnopilus dilepis TaxID=231916 RepID=A0A409Y6U6_9AGAR|nr:hypothetical protein CVT26_013814 [Gymnopilus dilepis]
MNAAPAVEYSVDRSPYAYVPVDPFKPSLAFSLRNLFRRNAEQNDVETGESLYSPPPPQQSKNVVQLGASSHMPTRRKMGSVEQDIRVRPESPEPPDVALSPPPRAMITFEPAVVLPGEQDTEPQSQFPMYPDHTVASLLAPGPTVHHTPGTDNQRMEAESTGHLARLVIVADGEETPEERNPPSASQAPQATQSASSEHRTDLEADGEQFPVFPESSTARRYSPPVSLPTLKGHGQDVMLSHSLESLGRSAAMNKLTGGTAPFPPSPEPSTHYESTLVPTEIQDEEPNGQPTRFMVGFIGRGTVEGEIPPSSSRARQDAQSTSSEQKIDFGVSRLPRVAFPDSVPTRHPIGQPHKNPASQTPPTLEQIQAGVNTSRMLRSSSTSRGEMILTGPPTSLARVIFACRRCRMLKVRCEYTPGRKGTCNRCHNGGHECVIDRRMPRRSAQQQASSASSVSTIASALPGPSASLPQSTVGVANGDSPEPDDIALPGPVPVQQVQGSTETPSESLSDVTDLFYIPPPATAQPQSLPNIPSSFRSGVHGSTFESQPDYRLEAQALAGTRVETSPGGTDDEIAPGDQVMAQLSPQEEGNTLQNQTENVATSTPSQPLSACRRCKILKLDCQYPAGLLGKCQHCQSGRHECVILSQPVEEDTSRPSFSRFTRSTTAPLIASPVAAYNSQHPLNSILRRPLQGPTIDEWPAPELSTDHDGPHTSKTSTPLRPASPATSGSGHVPIARLSLQGDLSLFGATKVYRMAAGDAFTSSPFQTGSHVESPAQSHSTSEYILAFFLDTVPRQIYLHLLLRLPYLYYSRVTRIFEEAEMSMPMIKQGILEAAKAKSELQRDAGMGRWTRGGLHTMSRPYLPMEFWEPQLENAAYLNLQNTWHTFVDSLQKEWKTLNIISVLLLTAILTILQIPSAAADPATRYTALLSMICALMSLLYGCIYIIRFGTMRKTYKGAEWAQEAQKSRTGIFWNVWVLLAMPATWLSWSMVMYIVTIMSFVWRTTPFSQPSTTDESPVQVLIPRLIISLVVTLGVVYFFLIATTLRKYGELMDRAWQTRIWGWMQDGNFGDLEKGRPKEAESSYEAQEPDGIKFGGPINSFSKNDLNQRDVPQNSGSPIPKDVDPSHGVSMANIINAKARPSSAPGSTNVEARPNDTDAGALFSTFNWQQTFVLPRASETRFNEDNAAAFKTHEGSHSLDTAFAVSHPSSNQESQSRDFNSEGTASLALAAGATTFKSPATRCVRLFGFSENEDLTSSLYHIVSIDDPNLENISGLEWDTFRKEVLKIIASSTSDETGQLDLSLLTPVLHDFNHKLRMHGSNGRISVSRVVADNLKGTDAYANYAVYYVSNSSEQSKY